MEKLESSRYGEITTGIESAFRKGLNLTASEFLMSFGIEEERIYYSLKSVSVEEARFFLQELRKQLIEHSLLFPRDIHPELLLRVNLDAAKKRQQEVDDITGRKTKLVLPKEDYFDHEMKHVLEAAKQGMDFSQTVLSAWFYMRAHGLLVGLSFENGVENEETAIHNVLIALAPEVLSDGDIGYIIQMMADYPKAFLSNKIKTAKIVHEFCRKTGYTAIRLFKEIRRTQEFNVPNALRIRRRPE